MYKRQVKNIDASRQAFEELGYVFDPVVNDTDRNIFISFGRLGDYRIELVSPLDPALPSPVSYTHLDVYKRQVSGDPP